MAIGSRHELPPPAEYPRFRLRTLFAIITVCGLVFGAMHAMGAVGSAAFLLFATLIGLHVAGNALGTSRRDQQRLPDSDAPSPESRNLYLTSYRSDAASRHRLRERSPLGWVMPTTSFGGACAGIGLGLLGLRALTQAEMPGLLVGAASAGVLGGLFGFLLGGFLEIARRAWWQATCEARCGWSQSITSSPPSDVEGNVERHELTTLPASEQPHAMKAPFNSSN